MRCLGRLISGLLLVMVLAAAWLYRDDLQRWVRERLHPGEAALRIGHPSASALASATRKLDSLGAHRLDSVVVNADEMASLLVAGVNFLPGRAFDSVSVELGQREVRIRTMIDSAAIPPQVRDILPGHRRYEVLTARAAINPVRAGEAELQLRHVEVRGIPLPSSLVTRVAGELTGGGRDGRLVVDLPQAVSGFRVRPDGVAIYREGGGS